MDAEGGLTREDFDSWEDWLRYCHEGGIDIAEGDDRFSGVSGSGYYASLQGAILGRTRRAHERAWLDRGLTDSVSAPQFQKAYRAVALANCLGMMMNTSVDVAWSTANIQGDLSVNALQREFLDALRRWFDRNELPAAWIWVLEQGAKLGLHSHLLIHVPDDLTSRFRRYATETLARLAGGQLATTDGLRTLNIEHRKGIQPIPQWVRFRYMMKGLRNDLVWLARDDFEETIVYAERVGVEPKPQGQVRVKRLGVSRSLDETACKRWASLNNFPSWRIRPEYSDLYDDRFIGWFLENRDQIRSPDVTRNGSSKHTRAGGRRE